MMPLGLVTTLMRRLNHTIFILGVSAIIFGAVLFGLLSRKITKPLDNLVSGVRALAAGDYAYSITPEGTSEVALLSSGRLKRRGLRRWAGQPAPFHTICGTTWRPWWPMRNFSTRRMN